MHIAIPNENAISKKLPVESTGNSALKAFEQDVLSYARPFNLVMRIAVQRACHQIGQDWLRAKRSQPSK